ncbi:MAG: methyltransferase domain-containing protein [Gammaproteobacteria bacterium]|nr:methyltransferase domain-containing protein [Gammaproteobacteria bacterium]
MSRRLSPHALLPDDRHDERERQAFVGALRGHLAGRVMPGNYAIYRASVEPEFERHHGRKPVHHNEVRAVMERHPYYQFWSALQRCSQQRMWDAVIDSVERAWPRLNGKLKRSPKRGSLRLDPALPIPRYHTAADIHLQPGGYHTDFVDGDVAAGAIYDLGLNIYSHGMMGPRNEYLGNLLIQYFLKAHRGFKPQRILDLGCAIGNSTLPWARQFKNARVDAIDVAAPQLRYAHARAESLGVPVHFSQQNAERTTFEDQSFDLVISHIMLHETSRSALKQIFVECHRLLRSGGLMLHLEIPRGKTVIENFLYNWESWNNNETFGQYMTHIDLADIARQAGFASDKISCADHAVPREKEQQLYSEETLWKIVEAHR